MIICIATSLSLTIKRISFISIFIFQALIFCTYASIVNAGEKLVFTSINGAYNQRISEAVLKIAYKRLGVDFETSWLPAKRALIIASEGLSDGEISRVVSIEKIYPGLIRVNVPINYLEAIAFTKDKNIEVKGWESLRPYTIGVTRGIVFIEKETKGMNTQMVNSFSSLFDMLDKSRIDVAVSPLIIGLYHINKHGMKDVKINTPPLTRLDQFHFLHERHANMVAPLEAILKNMQEKGEIESIRSDLLRELKMGVIRSDN